jgi:hypothetical protein
MRKLALVATLVAVLPAAHAGERTAHDFEGHAPGRVPSGFAFARTGKGSVGAWRAVAVDGAPSGKKVLAQLDVDPTSDRFAIAALRTPSAADLRLSVRCRMVGGAVDRACGVVFRYQSPKSYYVARANDLEDNVRLYHVVGGRRTQIGSWDGAITGDAWHELAVEAKGDALRVFWNGAKVIDVRDGTLSRAGLVGLWTKADSLTFYDDLVVETR